MKMARLERVSDVLVEGSGARIVADDVLFAQIGRDRSLEQLSNVSMLPGIVPPVVGMPDMHEGYGFPVGGVAATAWPDGVVSPGGIGFDINCGVRLLASPLARDDFGDVERVLHELMRSIPAGYGHAGRLELEADALDAVLEGGAPEMVRRGLGSAEDLGRLEEGGRFEAARASAVSSRAKARGRAQLGTLGGGNHFLELEYVQAIFDADAAAELGLSLGGVTVLLHTGSRGLGHQVCTDHVRAMDAALARHRITLPDRQLACAPLSSKEGEAYFAAMCAAANFAWANREVLTHRVREVFAAMTRAPALRVVYDVAHNIAKIEEHGNMRVCVHRKGATRAFRGQPVLIPGSMGTASFVLMGTGASQLAWSSACHGAGRAMSRTSAKQQVRGSVLRRELAAHGIAVRCASNAELAEEAPIAYKDVERVVDVVHRAGLARKVARLRPIGVLKG